MRKGIICAFKCTITLVLILGIIHLMPSYLQREWEYYSEEDNFISVTTQIDFINYSEDGAELYLGVGTLPKEFSDDCFRIAGKNCEVIQQNGGADRIKIGAETTFVTAPRYFGDGYVMPIVAISVDGETLLEYEQGYENYMELLKSDYIEEIEGKRKIVRSIFKQGYLHQGGGFLSYIIILGLWDNIPVEIFL